MCLSSEIDANVNEEVLVAGTCEIVIADVGYTKVEAYFGVDHLIFGATAKAQTTVETIVIIERVVRVLVFVKLGLAASETGLMQYGVEFKIESDYSDGEKIRRFFEKEAGVEKVDITYGEKQVFFYRTGFEDYERLSAEVVSFTAGRALISKEKEAYFLTGKS